MDDAVVVKLDDGETNSLPEKAATEKSEQILFSGIEVGTVLSIEIPGVQGRFVSRLLGFEPDQFLIIKLPSTPGIRQLLKPGSDIIVRFISNGSIIGLLSSIIQLHYEPVGVGFLAFPVYAERVSLRKDKRVQCFFAAVAHIKDSEFQGAILDISTSGCRFLVDESQGGLKRLSAIEKKEMITLSVEAFGSTSIGGEIASIGCESGLYNFGVEFTDISPELRAKIESMQIMASKVQT